MPILMLSGPVFIGGYGQGVAAPNPSVPITPVFDGSQPAITSTSYAPLVVAAPPGAPANWPDAPELQWTRATSPPGAAVDTFGSPGNHYFVFCRYVAQSKDGSLLATNLTTSTTRTLVLPSANPVNAQGWQTASLISLPVSLGDVVSFQAKAGAGGGLLWIYGVECMPLEAPWAIQGAVP